MRNKYAIVQIGDRCMYICNVQIFLFFSKRAIFTSLVCAMQSSRGLMDSRGKIMNTGYAV